MGRRLGRFWLVPGAGLVLLFLGVNWLTDRGAGQVEGLAAMLETHAMSSIDELTAVRGALRHVTISVRDLSRGGLPGTAALRRGIADEQRTLDAGLAR